MIETQAGEITNEDYAAALHLAHSEVFWTHPEEALIFVYAIFLPLSMGQERASVAGGVRFKNVDAESMCLCRP